MQQLKIVNFIYDILFVNIRIAAYQQAPKKHKNEIMSNPFFLLDYFEIENGKLAHLCQETMKCIPLTGSYFYPVDGNILYIVKYVIHNPEGIYIVVEKSNDLPGIIDIISLVEESTS